MNQRTSIPPQENAGQAGQIDWEGLFQSFPDGLIATDCDFTIRFVNAAFVRMTCVDRSEILAKKCHAVFRCNLCHTPDCPLTRVQATGRPQIADQEKGHCKIDMQKDGLVNIVPFFDANGSFAGICEKITDSSILRSLQAELDLSHERMRKTMGAVIQAMSMTIEKRDPYTAGHQRRVAKLCRAIATELCFSWERIQGLRMAAAIHDLGKINVPAGILNKPGPMTEPEMAIIRLHPRTAYDILKGIHFPWPLAETIYQHHERLDGSGYPRQLKGDQILLEARILAVADVVESMVSFRPYRPDLGLESALDELRRNSGILYDPRVVEACIVLLTEKGFDFQTKVWRTAGQPCSTPDTAAS